jgi:creatinine deaminase
MYTTMSPCDMCSGACLKYGVKRVVLGENKTFKGPEEHLKERGVEIVNLESEECVDLIKTYFKEHPNAIL